MAVALFPDIEALAVGYLKAELAALSDSARVATSIPNPRPSRLVRVTRNGGAITWPATDKPLVIFQCWDTDTRKASDLCGIVRDLVWTLPDAVDGFGRDVRRVREVGGPAYFPDPLTAFPRYQFTAEFHTRGRAR